MYHGIIPETIYSYTNVENGVAKRKSSYVLEVARSLMFTMNLQNLSRGMQFWMLHVL